jgi:hypothetical protein
MAIHVIQSQRQVGARSIIKYSQASKNPFAVL